MDNGRESQCVRHIRAGSCCKYSGHYGWTFSGQVQKLGEDRVVYAGVLPGVMFNNEGKGFMHKSCHLTDVRR